MLGEPWSRSVDQMVSQLESIAMFSEAETYSRLDQKLRTENLGWLETSQIEHEMEQIRNEYEAHLGGIADEALGDW